MNPQAEDLNRVIEENNKNIYSLLSNRGKEIFFPAKGILGQSVACKGTKINATIGAAFEDDGTIMHLDSIQKNLNINPSKAYPYASSYGRADLRQKWQEMILEKNPSIRQKTISLPVVTNALTNAISIVAYLFIDEGDKVIMPNFYWGNYNLALKNAYGAEFIPFELFNNGGFNVEGLKKALNSTDSKKKIVIFNFPNNPTGYSPTLKEMDEIVGVIKSSAEEGNQILAFIDDAYFGLVYKDDVSTESIFAPLSNIHENVLAVKIDGATKEDYAWGFRVGFITYGTKNGNKDLYKALESKTGGAVRGNISNASNLSQSLLLEAYNSEEYKAEKKKKYDILKGRYDKLSQIVSSEKFQEYFSPLPYNSGYFMCIQLKKGIDGNRIQKILIEKYSVGVIVLGNILRIAFSAVKKDDIEYLFESIYKACQEVDNQ